MSFSATSIKFTDHSATRSSITTLNLSHFRNYESLVLECGAGSVVLTGPNGSGKTNILEAISLLGSGRGLRNATLAEIVKQPDAGRGWAVSAELETIYGSMQIGTGQPPGHHEKRTHRLNGEAVKNHQDIAEVFACLWQTPQMDQLFGEGASARRRYFDRLAVSFDPEHASRVARYDYLRRERARLLTYRQPDAQWLSSLERKMAEASVAIASARLAMLGALQESVKALHEAFPKGEVTLCGFAEDALCDGRLSALDIEDEIAARLAQSREADAPSGRASHGAHKTTLEVMHPETGMEAAYCSTGQQKALLLSLLLAQAQAVKTHRRRIPILLLDEVVAHLDATRRAALFEALGELDAQCWLTGTDAELFAVMDSEAMNFSAINGQLRAAPLRANL